MKEVDTEQMIKLRELEVEEKRIVSKRIYIAIWLIISILLISLGIYGFAIDNMELGLTCFIWGLVLGIGGCEVLGVIALVKYIRKNRQEPNLTRDSLVWRLI